MSRTTPLLAIPNVPLFKEGDAGGESVDVVFSADRPEFALSEEAGQRDRPNIFLDRFGIVIWLGK